MATRVMNSPEDLEKYDHWVKGHPHGNLWQSLEWKQYQEILGREVRIYVMEDSSTPSPWPSPQGRGNYFEASALVVIDRTTFGLSTWDVPRGPLYVSRDTFHVNHLLKNIVQDTKQDKCMSLYLSPPMSLQTTNYKLQTSHRHEQPEATRVIDLTQSDETIFAQMKPKGRYNIHVAQKNDIEVSLSQDIDAFYELLQGTSKHDGFKTLPKSHYKAFLEHLPGSFLLLAYLPQPPLPEPNPPQPSPRLRPTSEGEGIRPIAGLMGVLWGSHGIYYYGASDYAHRALMAPYLLQWEALRYCRAKGCTSYDLLGILPPDPLTLTAPLREREQTHPWAGVSKFKEQFGGTVVQYPPEQELTFRPWVKWALELKRRFF